MLLAFQYGLNYGFKKTVWTLAGLTCGLIVWLVLSITGVSVLSQKMPMAFEVFKCLGALYLAYLGWQAWRSTGGNMSSDAEHIVPTPSKLFRMGMAVALSNPKAILFFISFFVQFVDPSYPYPVVSFAVLAGILQVVSLTYLSVLIFSGAHLVRWFRSRHKIAAAGLASVGALFMSFAIKLWTATIA